MIFLQVVTVLLVLAALVMVGLMIVMVREFSLNMKEQVIDTNVFAALSDAGNAAKVVADDLRGNLLIQRAEFKRLVTLLDRLDSKITVGADTALRIEDEGVRVAGNLTERDARADGVSEPVGAAADAAAKSRRPAKKVQKRQD